MQIVTPEGRLVSLVKGDLRDWSVGLTYTLGHFNLGLKYIDGSDLEEADGTPDDVRNNQAVIAAYLGVAH